jgi:hypothetical protein
MSGRLAWAVAAAAIIGSTAVVILAVPAAVRKDFAKNG